MGEQAEKMHGIGMPRIGLENLPIEQFRLVEPAGLVMLRSLSEPLLNRLHEMIPGCHDRRSGL